MNNDRDLCIGGTDKCCGFAAILVGASESGDELEELGSDSDTMEHQS